ncbi:MAG: hypothetical protein ABT03_15540 [Comamonas sp. SCN 67-35]|uniref:hypothetical protein n=1 Tax=Comamonas sp. SCN 67-35 TaxID=1660096 RepID=UPI00086C64D9|nr:hypothetical protein [Comamonas sp. SCN 67-35]ODU36654.1 MAG: hypothetical protein ABT03_15540 [Comamonas sp. SCN 67-35]OJV69542.1 MAG: hypothetical protein BGO35_00085 [Burkholderiales bacterium 64-34]
MPFYRLKTGIVHVKGTRLPRPCAAHVLIDGHEQLCAAWSTYLCDGPAQGRDTCDMPLCEAHAREIGPNRHLCPACHLSHRYADPQRGLFSSLIETP